MSGVCFGKTGFWRLDVAKKDWYQQNRLLSNLKMMVSKEGCHSHLIQELVAADPDPTAVLRLNLREPSVDELESISYAAQRRRLNSSQQKAMLASVEKKLL